jgi:hypothetical protein
VEVELTDVAGNRAKPILDVVAYDVEWPSALDVALRRDPEFVAAYDDDGSRVRFSRVDPVSGSPVLARLTVQASKDVALAPSLQAIGVDDPSAVLDCELGARSQRRFDFICDPAGVDADNYRFVLQWKRARGSTHEEQLGPVLDLVLQSPKNRVDASSTQFTRQPFGTDATKGVPRLFAEGRVTDPDAVEVLVLDPAGTVLGRGLVRSDLSFQVDALGGGELVEISSATVDASGNLSVVRPVSRGEWVGIVAPSTTVGSGAPSRSIEVSTSTVTSLGLRSSVAGKPIPPGALRGRDGFADPSAVAQTSAQVAWQLGDTGCGGFSGASLVYDPTLGEIVEYSGATTDAGKLCFMNGVATRMQGNSAVTWPSEYDVSCAFGKRA